MLFDKHLPYPWLAIAGVCSLPSNIGSCDDYVIAWFFDTKTGMCDRFWYGGCEGNDNRFSNEMECREQCVEPQGQGEVAMTSQ